VPALCLLGLVAVLVPYLFGLNSPHAFFHAPASVPDTASVYSVVGSGKDAAANGPWLVAVNARTGQQRWQHAHATSSTSFTQDGSMLYAVAHEAGGISLSALYGATGAQTWHEELADVRLSSVGAPAVVVDGTLVLGLNVGVGLGPPTQLYAFRASDGRHLWHAPVSAQGGTIELDGGSGLVFTHGPYDGVRAWSIADGHHVWDGPRLDGHVMAGAYGVFELRRNGDVIGLNVQTGTVAWSAQVPGDLDAGILAQQVLYVTAYRGLNASGFAVDRVVSAFDVATGHQLWQYVPQGVGREVLAASTQARYLNDGSGIDAPRGREPPLAH
jgi:outer membrane protein assembly factor BamB